jgi:cobalt-zinc-cadmium efflux system membrane fusion protein
MRPAALLLACVLVAACDPSSLEPSDAEHAQDADSYPRGPHGGRLLEDGEFALEIAIYEAGVPPEFHAWATQDGREVPPEDVSLRVELHRLGGEVDRISFAPVGGYLRGNETVAEPHSFDVEVGASHAGREHRWSYESYEGRTTIADAIAHESGIATAIAGPGRITDTLTLYGAIATDLTRVRDVQGRFPGVIRSVSKRVGDAVRSGDALATIESNESLQTYAVTAPLAGVITARHAEPGEQTGAEPLFEIVDLSTVWAELSVFSRDRARLAQGAAVHLVADSGAEIDGTIDYLSPVGNRASQSVTARVVLDNADGRWTPGEFVEARVKVSETPVPLAVPASALQRFRELDVVFAKVGDVYEVRMVTLGRRDAESVEVLGGLAPGTEYVVGNSYLVKADIEKAGASHDH